MKSDIDQFAQSIHDKTRDQLLLEAIRKIPEITQAAFEECVRFAIVTHEGQVDKCGQPFILHPLRVTSGVNALTQHRTMLGIAVAHDVLEDAEHPDVARKALAELLPPEAMDVLDLLTNLDRATNEKMPYEEFVRRLADDPVARAVTIIDIEDNLAPWRRIADSTMASKLRARYEAALRYLSPTVEVGRH